MIKRELLKELEKYHEDTPIILGDKESGWCNVGEIKKEDGLISIMSDYTRPFTSDNE